MVDLRHRIDSAETVMLYRTIATAFTRQRQLPFAEVLLLILIGHQRSMQRSINVLCRHMNSLKSHATDSAYSQARKNISPEVFLDLQLR